AMILDRLFRLQALEEVRSGAREDREAIRGGTNLLLEPPLDRLDILFEALPLGRPQLEIGDLSPQLLSQEGRVIVLPSVVGLRVQIEADERERHRLHPREPVERLRQRRILT